MAQNDFQQIKDEIRGKGNRIIQINKYIEPKESTIYLIIKTIKTPKDILLRTAREEQVIHESGLIKIDKLDALRPQTDHC